MRPLSLVAASVLVAVATLTLSSCGTIGEAVSFFGDQPRSILVQNNSAEAVYAGATDYVDGTGAEATIEAGHSEEVVWTSCKTAWLVLSASEEEDAATIAKHKMTACPGDSVVISKEHGVAIECGEKSRDQRENGC